MTPADSDGNATAFTTLSSTLWRLRELLDQLLFKVFETQLVMQSGQPKWLARASRELDSALQEVRHVEVLRAVETLSIADQLGLAPGATLAEIARSAPSPWDTIFLEHRYALRALAAEVDGTTAGDPAPPGAPGSERRADEFDDEIGIVRKFLVETLANAPQASLTAFIA